MNKIKFTTYKMKKFKYLVSLLLFALCACTGEEQAHNLPLDLFENSVDAESIVLIAGEEVNTAEQILVFDSLMVVHNQFIVDDEIFLYGIFDLTDQIFVNYYGREGRGPDEFHFPSFMSRVPGDYTAFGIYDRRKAQYELIALNAALTNSIAFYPVPPTYMNFVKAQDNFVGTGRFSGGRYAVSDTLGTILVNTGEYPFQNQLDLNEFSAGMAFQSRIAAHNNGSKFVSATSASGNLEIFEVENEKKEINLLHKLHSYPPKFVDESRGEDFISVSWHPENRWGYHNIDISDKYIYALFSGKEIGETDYFYFSDIVLVYDWDANPVTAIRLDKEVSDISVDRNDSKLYGLHMDEAGNVEILSFEINMNIFSTSGE